MMSTTAKVALALMLLGSESFGARRRSQHGEAVHRTTLKDCDNRYRRSRSKALVRVVSAMRAVAAFGPPATSGAGGY